MFRTDRPIKSFEEDLLGRENFSSKLSEAISNYKLSESIVIGLYGPWGSGKTSIINMVVEGLEKRKGNASEVNQDVVIIKFNPWCYSDQNILFKQFFNSIAAEFKSTRRTAASKKVGKLFESYSKLFEPLKIIPQYGLWIGLVTKVTNIIGRLLSDKSEEDLNDIDSIKSKIDKELSKLDTRLVVIIDDIDRLNQAEIRQVFQLVKNLADFPNSVYILAFDKDVVSKALEGVQNFSGEEYLEKIVQIPFQTPKVSKSEVENVLFKGLNELIEHIPSNEWNSIYWGNLYHSGIKYLISNLRDVSRFLNTLKFEFMVVRGEVNPIDFIAITAIQVFLPDLYESVKENPDIFVGVANGSFNHSGRYNDEMKNRCDAFIVDNYKMSKKQQIDFLKRMFPKLESIYGNMNYGYDWLSSWRKEQRICSPEIFDVYFKLSLDKGVLPKYRIEEAINKSEHLEQFKDTIIHLNQECTIHDFLDRILNFTERISEEQSINIIASLLDLAEALNESKDTSFGRGKYLKIVRIILNICSRFELHEKRYKILKSSIQLANNGLYGVVILVNWLDHEHGRFGSREQPEPLEKRTVNLEQLNDLEELAVDRIKLAAESGNLIEHEELAPILFRWREWGNNQELQSFIEQVLSTNKGIVNFLSGFLTMSTSQGLTDYVSKVSWNIKLETIGELCDVELLADKVREIDMSQFTFHDNKNPLKIFIDTVDGKIEEF